MSYATEQEKNISRSIEELADEYALVFIADYTEYPIDGKVHRELITHMTKFFNDACLLLINR